MRSPCCILLVVFLTQTPSINGSSRGGTIAETADQYVGSTRWSYASSHSPGRNTNKCNIFVADVLREAGVNVPQREDYTWSPIEAREWGNPQSSKLTSDSCWIIPNSPSVGDVIGDGVHVGIVTGRRLTTSAAADNVKKNDWGYRSSNSGIIYWSYQC